VAADAAEGLYRLVDAAYEKRSVAISSNLHPAKAHMFAGTYARCRRNVTGSLVSGRWRAVGRRRRGR
jgi:hypothetical protein